MCDFFLLVTVFRPRDNYLRTLLSSIEAQDASFSCLIAIDGAENISAISRTMLLNLAAKDARFKVSFFENHVGLAAHVERALKLRKSCRFVMIIDQDDEWNSALLSTALKAIPLQKPSATLVNGEIVRNGGTEGTLFEFYKPELRLPNVALVSAFPGAGIIFSEEVIKAALPLPTLDPNICLHDHYLLLVAERIGNFAMVDTPSWAYRQHPGNLIGARRIPSWRSIRRLLGLVIFQRRIEHLLSLHRQLDDHLPASMSLDRLQNRPISWLLSPRKNAYLNLLPLEFLLHRFRERPGKPWVEKIRVERSPRNQVKARYRRS